MCMKTALRGALLLMLRTAYFVIGKQPELHGGEYGKVHLF